MKYNEIIINNFCAYTWTYKKYNSIFALVKMVVVAQLVRALVCGAGGRGFESHHPP
jgi:hypothetical protein